jgi:hypothetical protein
MTDEMKRLLGANFRARPATRSAASRRQRVRHLPHRHVGQHVQLCLADDAAQGHGNARHLPQLKGWQVMNDQGIYMFPTFKGKWLPDTPEQRKRVIDRLRDWNAFSASNPAAGIVEASARTIRRA